MKELTLENLSSRGGRAENRSEKKQCRLERKTIQAKRKNIKILGNQFPVYERWKNPMLIYWKFSLERMVNKMKNKILTLVEKICTNCSDCRGLDNKEVAKLAIEKAKSLA